MKPYFKTKIPWLCLSCIAVMLTTANGVSQETRLWKSSDGQESLEASLHDYDKARRIVVLETLNGKTVELSINKLSKADRRYVRNADSKQDLASITDPVELKKTKKKRTTRISKRKSTARDRSRNTETLYGIHWTPGMESALAAARGRDGSQDDRPVMWFRVLGDLRGPM